MQRIQLPPGADDGRITSEVAMTIFDPFFVRPQPLHVPNYIQGNAIFLYNSYDTQGRVVCVLKLLCFCASDLALPLDSALNPPRIRLEPARSRHGAAPRRALQSRCNCLNALCSGCCSVSRGCMCRGGMHAGERAPA